MSKWMTIADESIDQKDTCTDIAPKEIVEFILEEVLLSALIISDKGCSRIGDFSITEDFCQQYDRHPFLRDFEQVNHSGNPSATNQESNVNSGKSTDRPLSLVTAKENLELIIDSLVKKEDKSKPGGECTIISEDVLADNELQIQNGQSHIEKINRGKSFPKAVEREYLDKKDVIKNEKIEIQYYNEGKLSKIYVPLIPFNRLDVETHLGPEKGEERKEDVAGGREEEGKEDDMENASGEMNYKEDTERPFKPFTTGEFRQVWEDINSSLVERWDGDVSAERKDAATLMEELSSVQVFTDGSVDPNRPRACAFDEEDVKKITKEIQEISLTQSHANSENFDPACHPDGQGDIDLDTKSFTVSNDKAYLKRTLEVDTPQEDVFIRSSADVKLLDTINSDESRGKEYETFSSEEQLMNNSQFSPENSISNQTLQFSSEKVLTSEGEEWTIPGTENLLTGKSTQRRNSSTCPDLKASASHVRGEPYGAEEEESLPNRREDGSADQVSDPNLAVDLPPEKTQQSTENLFGSYQSQSKEDIDKTIDTFLTIPEFRNEYEAKDPPFWGTAGGSKKNFELTSERDMMTFRGKLTDPVKTSRSVNDTKIHTIEPDHPPQQSAVSLAGLDSDIIEENRLKMKSFLGTEFEDNDSGSYLREPDPCSDCHIYDFRMPQNGDDYYQVTQREIGEFQNVLSCNANDAKDFANLESRFDDVGGDLTEEKQTSSEGTNLIFNKTLTSERLSQKNLNEPEESNDTDTNVELSPPPSQTKISSHSVTGSETAEGSEVSRTRSQSFKLHSQKIYSGGQYESDSQAQQECILTESDEAFIDITESVLQIIEPQEYSGDEDSSKVSFSLLCELPQREPSAPANCDSESELSLKKNCSSEIETTAKRVYSGMTTIGPLKNTDYDPKDLSVLDIDFGKMTRIISSRQLAKEIDLFGSELSSTGSIKIIEEDSDNDTSLNLEDDHTDFTSLVNRDIASLTKVQKVREVMSHQPKPEDDFEDEDALPRPRLDLKDVESMTDERYKVPEVSIPLLSLEINENNIGAEKELIENMGVVLTGLTSPVFYEENLEEDGLPGLQKSAASLENQKTITTFDNDYVQVVELTDEHADFNMRTSETATDGPNEQASAPSIPKEEEYEENQQSENVLMVGNTESQHDSFSNSPKYGTLGSVFRKASNKFIRKDNDLLLRNSKSLPRETASKINATDSIRSLWDDCQSSASNVLKKSKSLLKNTQSIFKSMSSSRVSSDRDSHNNIDKKKVSPSESDVSTLERKLSGFLKKEDFAKAKNAIKSKVEKTLKNLDSESSVSLNKVSLEKKDLQVAVIDEDKLRVDRMENFRKLLPKCPLVYKSQFVKSQMSMQKNSTESAEEASDCKVADIEQNDVEKSSSVPLVEAKLTENERISSAEGAEITEPKGLEIEIPLQESAQWSTNRAELSSSTNEEECEPQQPHYIVMETIQGLPTTDLESPSSEKENVIAITREQQYKRETVNGDDDMKKTEASNSFQPCADGVNDVAPCFPEYDEEKMATKVPSERKIKAKKKKLTARFRSFWCSTFGRVKTSPKKCDRS